MAVSHRFLSYIAGYVDGEGCFRINNGTPALEATNTYPDFLFRLKRAFGGNVRRHKQKDFKHRTTWRYALCGERALRLIRLLVPYLREKRPQAILVGRWSRERINRKQHFAELKRLKRINYATHRHHNV